MSVIIQQQPPNSAEAVELIAELDDYLTGHPYPAESRHAFSVEKLVREGVAFFVLRRDDQLAACGGIKICSDYGEVKRMYVRQAHRGLGLGKAVLNRISDYARDAKVSMLRLETGIFQVEAIGLYEAFGFKRRPPFGEYKEDPNSVYMEMQLVGSQ